MRQKKIVFLFGGPGGEHEVSLSTAKSTLPSFEEQFVLLPVFISKNGLWSLDDMYVRADQAWAQAEKLMKKKGQPSEIALESIEKQEPDVVFIGLHGQFGEDGTLQALLEARGLTYTGSDSEASALAMDKPKVFQILQDEDITVPDFLEVTKETHQKDIADFINYVKLPVVILPADGGSSVNVLIIRNAKKVQSAIKKILADSDRALISKYIPGREVSCGVLVTSKTELTALPPTELIPTPKHEFFDYEAKYLPGETKEITPPEMDEDLINRMKDLAKKVHQLVNADGYSRTDMIVDEKGGIHVLEINTLPGLTATSILPQQANVFGLSFPKLLTIICTHIDQSDQEHITAV